MWKPFIPRVRTTDTGKVWRVLEFNVEISKVLKMIIGTVWKSLEKSVKTVITNQRLDQSDLGYWVHRSFWQLSYTAHGLLVFDFR